MRVRTRVLVVAGALVAALLPVIATAPTAQAKGGAVKHIVVLMQENRSADHYLGKLNSLGQPAFEPEPTTGNPNPNPPPPVIVPFHKTALCETSDLNHSWNGTHQEWNNGAMDGFTAANDSASANADPADPNGARTMGYYDNTDLPFYYSLYNKFATGDRYFASVLSQTFPNRFFLLAGTSFGHIRNDLPPSGGFTQKTIFKLMNKAGVSWKIYQSQFGFGTFFSDVQKHPGHVFSINQYFADAKAGNLPEVSFVDPIFINSKNLENDEHPPANVQVGQQFVYKVTKALEKSPNWTSSALFLTYDEHGGFYDHVAPPAAVPPDGIPPMLQPGDTVAGFDRLGIRVPVVVISPFAKSHFVSHVVHDHTSILKFIEQRFGLPNLTARDAAADPMLEFFDFKHPPFVTPPHFTKPPVTLCP
jgi:phospholipase C